MIAFAAMLDEAEDKAAFEDIYNTYKSKMLAVAYNVLGNYHDSEEAVSQAFFTVAKSFGKIKGRCRPEQEAYINIVTRNAALDIYRKKKSENSVAIEDVSDMSDGRDDVSDEALSDFGYNRVVEAIRSLPEKYAEALYMFNVTGLSIREIAEAVSESEATVKKRLQRARCKLRELLEAEGIRV